MNIKDTLPELYKIRKPLKPGEVAEKLRAKRGKAYWRSLEELAETEEFQEMLHREFPASASEWSDPVGRRNFLKLMGASLALAGVTACSYKPTTQWAPYVTQPEEETPGKPLFFATAMPFGNAATGLLVKSNEGRPTKIEGNPDHPDSLGATDVYSQASLLVMYDPDRSKQILFRNQERSWGNFLTDVNQQLEAQKGTKGTGLRILTETVNSPTLAAQIKNLLGQFPSAKWYSYDPAGRDMAAAGAQMAFGQDANTTYRFDQAARILSLDSNFLSATPGNVRHTRQYASKRRPENGDMNRLYAVETTPTNTGAKAEHRLAIKPSEMESFARALASALGVGGVGAANFSGSDYARKFLAAVAKDLLANKGASVVVVGDEQPPVVHALGHAMNAALGNVGKTVFYTDPVAANPQNINGNNAAYSQSQSLKQLAQELDSGAVDMLVMIGGNPAYNAPADLDFANKLMKARWRVHHSLYFDETSVLCHWHVPATHFLESWSDARAADGTATIIQPLIAPLYDACKSAHEFLGVFVGQSDRNGYDLIRDFWQQQPQLSGADFEKKWRSAVHKGAVDGSAFPQKTFTAKTDFAAATPTAPAQGLEINFRPCPSIYDGRFANNGWLQELPRPLTKMTWDNAAIISPNTAKQLNLNNYSREYFNPEGYKGGEFHVDRVKLTLNGKSIEAPVWVLPGQPDDVVTVHLGYGRTRAGQVGNGVGFNAYQIRTTDAPWSAAGLQLSKISGRYTIATTQTHFLLEDRDPVRAKTLAEYSSKGQETETREGASEARGNINQGEAKHPSLYPKYPYGRDDKDSGKYKWGMAIDNSACTGCNACVIACVAENNIAVVGKEMVGRSREMHWLRIDAYYKGSPEKPEELETYFEPVPCMHCENAPCEPVCPVGATAHDAEGTNNMVYNRCIGTRYCSNNCPYKVRRFNFLLFQDFDTPQYKLMRNPEVTVRSRGVMEKCSYCIQRIWAGKIEAEKEDRLVRDGEIQTACQSVCPADAIVFGDLNDNGSRVVNWKSQKRNFSLLGELNTTPRTTYLSDVRNLNPELKSELVKVGHDE